MLPSEPQLFYSAATVLDGVYPKPHHESIMRIRDSSLGDESMFLLSSVSCTKCNLFRICFVSYARVKSFDRNVWRFTLSCCLFITRPCMCPGLYCVCGRLFEGCINICLVRHPLVALFWQILCFFSAQRSHLFLASKKKRGFKKKNHQRWFSTFSRHSMWLEV